MTKLPKKASDVKTFVVNQTQERIYHTSPFAEYFTLCYSWQEFPTTPLTPISDFIFQEEEEEWLVKQVFRLIQ